MIEYIRQNNEILAIIISPDRVPPGIQFLTPDDFSQQLACMRHPKGKLIEPHVHNPAPRAVHYTQEVLLIRRGSVRVDFYDGSKTYLESRILCSGSVILLAGGGHGFLMLEETEMIEVKQGPYMGEKDKTRFKGIDGNQVRIHDGHE